MKTPSTHSAIPPLHAGLKACCPHCGQGRLYQGLLSPAKQCNACGLDYSFIDAGDGPAVFVIMVLGFIILALALFVEFTFRPPLWMHIIIWAPAITVTSIWALRFTKAMMIALQYKTKATQITRRENR